MFIEKRDNIVKKFSSFISFIDNHQIKLSWKIDLQLEKNMNSKIEVYPEAKESFWAQYFLKILLINDDIEEKNNDELNLECSTTSAKKHLSAYLQEACFKAAQDMCSEFKYIQHKYSLQDYFQIANIAANSPDKFFKNFNFKYKKINIEAYAITAFKRFIRNYIYRQDLEARRTRFSNYGLLKNLSVRELNNALVSQNFSKELIVLHRLAWECFNEIFQPTPGQLSVTRNPLHEDFVSIANFYNQRCNQLNISNTAATHITIEKMLLTCINAAKNYRNKQYFSLEEDLCIINDPNPSTLDILIKKEEWLEIQNIVDNLFKSMPEQYKIIFKLWQGLNLTQAEIAKIVKDKYPELQKQYQVARQLKKHTRNILKKFYYEWNKTNSEIYLNDEKDIEMIKKSLDECLQQYCQKKFSSMINSIFEKFSNHEKKGIFATIKYNQNPIKNKHDELEDKISLARGIKNKLINLFQHELEITMLLNKNSLSFVNEKIIYVVDQWIEIKQDNVDYGRPENVEF